jgi:hypothetical protein
MGMISACRAKRRFFGMGNRFAGPIWTTWCSYAPFTTSSCTSTGGGSAGLGTAPVSWVHRDGRRYHAGPAPHERSAKTGYRHWWLKQSDPAPCTVSDGRSPGALPGRWTVLQTTQGLSPV